MNSAKQCVNSAKQCVNSEPMWGYCSRAEKKKKKGQKTWTQQNAEGKRSHNYVTYFFIFYFFSKKLSYNRI